MLGLAPKRYVPVLLNKSAQKPVLIHPFSYGTLVRESMFLKGQTELSQDQFHAKEHFFERARQSRHVGKGPESWSDLVAMASELSLESVSLPCYSDEKLHNQSLHGLLVGMTDLYDPKWTTQNIGSSRNVLLSETQIKGCGRTLPVNNFWHRLSSGTSLIRESVHSFIISHLIDTTLPLGGLPAHAVYLDTESDDGKSLYLRAAESVRLAQLPEKIDQDELRQLKAALAARHPGCGPKEIINRVMAQYASIAFLGAALQSTPDNLLLDGRPLDEEEWKWPKKSGQFMMGIIFWQDGDVPETSPQKYPWEKTSKIQTTFSIYEKKIRLYLEGLNQVLPHEITFSQAWEKFLQHLCALSSHHDHSAEKIRELWEEGRKIIDGSGLKHWIDKYAQNWDYKFGPSQPPGKYQFILSPDAIKKENFLSYASYGMSLESYQSFGVLKDNSFQISRNLLSVAAKFGICLPVTVNLKGETVPNIFSVKDWWESEVKTFQGWAERVTAVLFSDDTGNTHRVPVTRGFPDMGQSKAIRLIPIAAIIPMKEGELEIPLRKVFLNG